MDYDAETDVETDNDEASGEEGGSNTPGGEGRSRTSSASDDLFDGDDSDVMEVDENSNESSDATDILSGRSTGNNRENSAQRETGIERDGQGTEMRGTSDSHALRLGGHMTSGHIADRHNRSRDTNRSSQLSDSESNSERLFRNLPNMVQVSNEQLPALPAPASTDSNQPHTSLPSLLGNNASSMSVLASNAAVAVSNSSSQSYQPVASLEPHSLNQAAPGSSTNQAPNSENAAVPVVSSSVEGREQSEPSAFVNVANILNAVPRNEESRSNHERRDSLVDFKLPEKKKQDEKVSEDSDSDDESQTCSICYEPWSNSGSHRLASLKCGHVFGLSCIQKWLKGKDGKCPHCCAKAKKSDIRIIYAKYLKAIDTSERDEALKLYQKEKELRRKIEIEKAQIHLKYQLALEEVNRMKAQIRQSATNSFSLPGGSASNNDTAGPALPGSYVLEKTITASANGNSRVLVYDYSNSAIIASVPSSNQILFQGFGIKKIGVLNWHNQYLPIHSKPIRGMSFNGRNDGLLLTGAMDKTLKITSLASNTVVQSYDAPAPVWSCCWNDEDVNYLFAGLSNGTIVVYDTRNTSEEVLTLNREGSKHPIVAMNYVHKAMGSSFPCSGLLVGTLSNCSFWELKTSVDFTPHILPLEGNCVSLSFEPNTRHCLASFRPSKVQPSMRHVMCELHSTPVSGETEPMVKCNPVQSFFGGATVKLLARSTLFRRPGSADHLLVAAGDEGTNSLDLWDSNSGAKVQRISTGATILDVCPFRFNNQDYLAALSEKVIKLYQWKT